MLISNPKHNNDPSECEATLAADQSIHKALLSAELPDTNHMWSSSEGAEHPWIPEQCHLMKNDLTVSNSK